MGRLISIAKAASLMVKRWPVIRHVRWLYYHACMQRHYAKWAERGFHDGNKPHDLCVLDAIWRGEI